MVTLERLRAGHADALWAFERDNRACFARSVPDRGGACFTAVTALDDPASPAVLARNGFTRVADLRVDGRPGVRRARGVPGPPPGGEAGGGATPPPAPTAR